MRHRRWSSWPGPRRNRCRSACSASPSGCTRSAAAAAAAAAASCWSSCCCSRCCSPCCCCSSPAHSDCTFTDSRRRTLRSRSSHSLSVTAVPLFDGSRFFFLPSHSLSMAGQTVAQTGNPHTPVHCVSAAAGSSSRRPLPGPPLSLSLSVCVCMCMCVYVCAVCVFVCGVCLCVVCDVYLCVCVLLTSAVTALSVGSSALERHATPCPHHRHAISFVPCCPGTLVPAIHLQCLWAGWSNPFQ